MVIHFGVYTYVLRSKESNKFDYDIKKFIQAIIYKSKIADTHWLSIDLLTEHDGLLKADYEPGSFNLPSMDIILIRWTMMIPVPDWVFALPISLGLNFSGM